MTQTSWQERTIERINRMRDLANERLENNPDDLEAQVFAQHCNRYADRFLRVMEEYS